MKRLRIVYRGTWEGDRKDLPVWALELAPLMGAIFASTDPYEVAVHDPKVRRYEISGEADVKWSKTFGWKDLVRAKKDKVDVLAHKGGTAVAILSRDVIVDERWIVLP